MQLFNTPLSEPWIIVLTVAYAICAAITTFDIRIVQAKRAGFLSEDEARVPLWTGFFGYGLWLVWLAIFLLNWWYAPFLFLMKFILKVFPVLENIGAFILLPFIGKETASAVNVIAREQKKASDKLERLKRTGRLD